MGRRPEVFVREITMAEGQRLQRLGRTAKDPVKLRRSIVVLMSAQGQPAEDIAYLLQVTGDYVRDVIHAFNERGFEALDPKWTRRRLPVPSEPAGKRWYPLVSELAADGVPVAVTCRVLKIARQAYYRWLRRPVTPTEHMAAYRADALFDAHREDPEFGYRFLADEAAAAGQPMSDRTAWRICSGNGWWSAFGKRKRRGKGGKVGPPVHDDLVQRDFTADGPNRLWLADITQRQ